MIHKEKELKLVLFYLPQTKLIIPSLLSAQNLQAVQLLTPIMLIPTLLPVWKLVRQISYKNNFKTKK